MENGEVSKERVAKIVANVPEVCELLDFTTQWWAFANFKRSDFWPIRQMTIGLIDGPLGLRLHSHDAKADVIRAALRLEPQPER